MQMEMLDHKTKLNKFKTEIISSIFFSYKGMNHKLTTMKKISRSHKHMEDKEYATK